MAQKTCLRSITQDHEISVLDRLQADTQDNKSTSQYTAGTARGMPRAGGRSGDRFPAEATGPDRL